MGRVTMGRTTRAGVVGLALVVSIARWAGTQSQGGPAITSPKQQFGANIGDDYFLANYTQTEAYWKTLDRESDRMSLVDIGRTEEGRTQWMAVITAPQNARDLDRYREMSRRLARAEGLTDAEAQRLAAEGKAVVWIDGGLHANEVLGSQQLIETAYELVSRSDPETMRILRDVIVLLVHANPDGEELAANWYMREPDPSKRVLTDLPRLYQKYVGHDNNRDFYMSTQAETINMNRVLYRQWFPQIVYDHHQTAPAGTVMFAPPFRDPFNFVFDPLVPLGIDLLGAAMHARFAAEGKPGVTMRSGSTYSTWWNGGLRTTAYFHNALGLLTEAIGSPTPVQIPYVADRQVPHADLPYPIAPQTWHFRQAIEYELTANRAVLDTASRYRETLLFNMYRMGRNSIDRGTRDTWTVSPHRMAAATGGPGGAGLDRGKLRDPRLRDPRGYVLPADQPDFATATKFVNALIRNGVAVLRASAGFTANAVRYPAGSFVVKTDQAFRPHVLDMFEPQDYPDDISYPGAPPTPPYDIAGWTLAFQMGVTFDRILNPFDGPFEAVPDVVAPPAGQVVSSGTVAGFIVGHRNNDAAIVVNRLLKAGEDVYWLRGRVEGVPVVQEPGAIYVSARPSTLPILRAAASELGLTVAGVPLQPTTSAMKLRPVRVGLWDCYGGSAESGWLRWLLERYEFSFDIVYPQALDAGNLRAKYDVLIFPTDAVADADGREVPLPANLPDEYRARTGKVTAARTIPQIKAFVEQGGTVMAIGSSTVLARHLGLPVRKAVTQPRSRFYVPGSIVRVRVDNATPLGYGFEQQADVFFNDSPTFALDAEASRRGVRRVAWFEDEAPLRSGWAWGQSYLKGSAAIVDVPMGLGRVLLVGPEIAFRAQSHGTFKFLFNGIQYAGLASGSR